MTAVSARMEGCACIDTTAQANANMMTNGRLDLPWKRVDMSDIAIRRSTLVSSAEPSPTRSVRHDSHKRPRDRQSEEHTSELQSHHDLVCRLLLEKKKTKT